MTLKHYHGRGTRQRTAVEMVGEEDTTSVSVGGSQFPMQAMLPATAVLSDASLARLLQEDNRIYDVREGAMCMCVKFVFHCGMFFRQNIMVEQH